MYKLVIGNVKITVEEDKIQRNDAIFAARKAIAEAGRKGKVLSSIHIQMGVSELETDVFERLGAKTTRKTIKQSIADSVLSAAKEKLYPTSPYAQKDVWVDGDTGQEWRGSEVDTARSEVMVKLEEWVKTL